MSACRHRPIECAVCGLKLRGALASLARTGLPTCACGERMIPTDLEDAARLAELMGDPAVYTSHPDAAAAEQAWVAQTLRQVSRTGNRLHCGGCHRFIPAANTHCGCGFLNDLRGRRNVGGWSAAPAPSSMPF